MKYVVVLCDGMADEPLEELGGMTPLEKAHTPNLDRMAADFRDWHGADCSRRDGSGKRYGESFRDRI